MNHKSTNGEGPKPLHLIDTLNEYLRDYGGTLGRKAIDALDPLHVPGRDPLPDFSGILREPFEPQKHVVAAAVKMLDEQGNGFLAGECGVGKTLCGMLAMHQHAKDKPYRALVLCPDHIIGKWVREIQETIPGAEVTRFKSWRDVLPLMAKGNGQHWRKPLGPEWYVLGRNQAKFYPAWEGVGERSTINVKHIVVGHDYIYDDNKKKIYDQRGNPKMIAITAEVATCPRCGKPLRDKKGIKLSPESVTKTQVTCSEKGCGEPAWQYTTQPYRWPPARIIQKKLRKFFKYLIIDECHEAKSDSSGRSMAAGKLMASARHTLAMTGTLIGGKADHLYPLMMRMTLKSLKDEGFEWGKSLAFSQVYGKVDRIITTKEDGGSVSVGRSVRSMRRARAGSSSERTEVRPGIMPSLFGRHLIGSSVFISLSEMADELPALREYVGGEPDEDDKTDPFWVNTACEMEPDQKQEYERVQTILVNKCKELLAKGSMKLLGAMLWTLLDYPDRPYGWEPAYEGELAVGYHEVPKLFTPQNWVSVVQPADLPRDVIYPKEEAIIDICKRAVRAGEQAWVYLQMTRKRDIQPRLKTLLEEEGLRVGILRAGTVDLKQREDWIIRNGSKYDVMLSHPELVSLGLDLFSKEQGGHNYNTICFYQTGYQPFVMWQAARRAWRIAQPRDCRIYYLYYKGTMQQRAMKLMAEKMEAAMALDGKFSTEGLCGLAGAGSAQMALAKSLSERIDDADIRRTWGKLQSGSGRKLKVQEDILAALPEPVQLALETILDSLPSEQPSSIQESPGAPVAPTREHLASMWRKLVASGMKLDDFFEEAS